MDIDKLIDNSFDVYFNILSKLGNIGGVKRLLLISFIHEFLNDDRFNIFITENDYMMIYKTVYNIYGVTCLLPFPEYTLLVHKDS